MRVVSGTAGGLRLRAPDGMSTRPTSDRVREAVFNALGSAGAVADARVLDLFAGSGAMGIEALSRGATHAWFVEADASACSTIAQNLSTTGLADRATVIQADHTVSLGRIEGTVDLVVADPPYGFDGWIDLMAAVSAVASPDAMGVLESDRSIDVGDGWEKMRERVYGGTVITYVSVIDTGHSQMNDNATGADP